MNKIKLFASLCTLLSLNACAVEGADSVDYEKPGLEAEILEGNRVENYDHPVVALFKEENGEIRQHCTGTMVSSQIVLTAAHCTDFGIDKMEVVNCNNVYDENCTEEKKYEVEEKAQHPEYDRVTTTSQGLPWNDLALVRLKKPMKNAVVVPILPPELYDKAMPVGSYVTIAGYGCNSINPESRQSRLYGILYAGEAPVIERKEFESKIGDDGDEVQGAVNMCWGDSGGPVLVVYEGQVYVAGVASRMPNLIYDCGHGGVYTNPGSYPWLQEKMEEWGIKSIGKTVSNAADDLGCECDYSGNPDYSGLLPFFIGIGLLGLRRRNFTQPTEIKDF